MDWHCPLAALFVTPAKSSHLGEARFFRVATSVGADQPPPRGATRAASKSTPPRLASFFPSLANRSSSSSLQLASSASKVASSRTFNSVQRRPSTPKFFEVQKSASKSKLRLLAAPPLSTLQTFSHRSANKALCFRSTLVARAASCGRTCRVHEVAARHCSPVCKRSLPTTVTWRTSLAVTAPRPLSLEALQPFSRERPTARKGWKVLRTPRRPGFCKRR